MKPLLLDRSDAGDGPWVPTSGCEGILKVDGLRDGDQVIIEFATTNENGDIEAIEEGAVEFVGDPDEQPRTEEGPFDIPSDATHVRARYPNSAHGRLSAWVG